MSVYGVASGVAEETGERFSSAMCKPVPIMLLILPIIPSRISYNFYPLFLFYSHVITYYSCYIL